MSEFTELTPLAAAQATLRDLVDPTDRTEPLALESAHGRVAAESVTAERAIPHYRRAAMDGYAVRAADTEGASERRPTRFDVGDDAETVGPNVAVPVDTGAVVPDDADAVVTVEATEPADDGGVLIATAVPPGDNVAPIGEDVAEGDAVVERGERVGPAHLGLLRGVGVESVACYERPDIALVPTGEELVASDPAPGQIVETNSLTIGALLDRWGGRSRRHAPVTDDRQALEGAIEDCLDADLVVTLGGTSVGDRDLVPAAVDSLGEMVVHGVAFRPGHPVGIGEVDETPVVTLPGYPVGCLVAAQLLVRPAVATLGHLPIADPPTTEAVLDGKIASDLGSRTYARVALSAGDEDSGDHGEPPTATPIRAKGSGVLSSVADADGWVVVAENSEGVPAGRTVAVERWEGWC